MTHDPSHNPGVHGAGSDSTLTALLRSTYAAPTDASYWSGLEQRVLLRVRQNGPVAWWVAAAAAIFLVGATTIREQQENALARERAAMAIEANPFDLSVEPVNIATSPRASSSPRGRSSAPERYLDLIRP